MTGTKIKKYILDNRDDLINKIMDEQEFLLPQEMNRYNSNMMEKVRSDTSSNLNYLAQALAVGEKNIFVNYYSWLYTVLKERGIGIEVLKKHLKAIKNVLYSEFTQKDFNLIKNYLNSAENKI